MVRCASSCPASAWRIRVASQAEMLTRELEVWGREHQVEAR
jgi:hypothetical protein